MTTIRSTSSQKKLKAIFFDLDYTLYDQTQYLRGALSEIAKLIAEDRHLDSSQLCRSLLETWDKLGTDCTHLFDDWLDQHGILDQCRVQQCVEIFHSHQPQGLAFYPDVEETLSELKSRYVLGIITDGNAQMQERKIKALSLEKYSDLTVIVKNISMSKPDPRILQYALSKTSLSAFEAVYVGDHPVKDIVGARRAGLHTVRCLSGEFRHLPDDEAYPPHFHIRYMTELGAALKAIESEL